MRKWVIRNDNIFIGIVSAHLDVVKRGIGFLNSEGFLHAERKFIMLFCAQPIRPDSPITVAPRHQYLIFEFVEGVQNAGCNLTNVLTFWVRSLNQSWPRA